MTTEARIHANRLNAQKSTGPRTEEGKARSRANGVRHGLRAEKILVMDEDPVEYAEYRRGMMESLRPEGGLERTLAERVVAQGWRLRRAERAEAALLNRDLGKCHHFAMHELPPEHRQRWDEEPDSALVGTVLGQSMSGPANSYETLRRYERTIERGFYAALHELRAVRKERGKRGEGSEEREEERRGRGEKGDMERKAEAAARPPSPDRPCAGDPNAPSEPNPAAHQGGQDADPRGQQAVRKPGGVGGWVDGEGEPRDLTGRKMERVEPAAPAEEERRNAQ